MTEWQQCFAKYDSMDPFFDATIIYGQPLFAGEQTANREKDILKRRTCWRRIKVIGQ